MTRTATFTASALLAAAFAIPVAQAQSVAATPELRAAQAAKKGPQALRRFIHRTRMIYALNFHDFYPAKD